MRHALVTGGEQGIGQGFVTALLADGWTVFATTRREQAGLPTHERLTWVPLELTSDESLAAATATIEATTPTLELLVNNAGLNKDTATGGHKAQAATLGHLEREPLLRLFDVNTVAPLLLTQHLLPLLSHAARAHILNVSSCRASFHDEWENPYGNYGYRASKVALNMVTHCLVKDLPPHVQTCAVHPGNVRTAMNPDGTDDPLEQATRMLNIITTWEPAYNGSFLRYDGTRYPL